MKRPFEEALPGPEGKALVTVDDGGQTEDGKKILVLKVYMNNDEPRLEARYRVEEGQLVTEDVTERKSAITTTGEKVYT